MGERESTHFTPLLTGRVVSNVSNPALRTRRRHSTLEFDDGPRKSLICVAVVAIFALVCVATSSSTDGPIALVKRFDNGRVEDQNLTVFKTFSVPGEWNETCDTSSESFRFGNQAKGVDRVAFSMSAVIVMIVDALQAGLAMLSTPAEPIPAIDVWLVDPQFETDISMRLCPGNHFIRLGNLVPDTMVWKDSASQWSTLVDEDGSGRFKTMGVFAKLMATTIPNSGRRKGAELKFKRAVQALLDMPKQINIGRFKLLLPWNMRTAKYLFFGQLLFMMSSMAWMSWCSRPDFSTIVLGDDLGKWVKLAFRREMLLPIVFRMYYVCINYNNVLGFFRGNKDETATIAKIVFWVLVFLSALPLLCVFAPAVLVAGGIASLICMLASTIHDLTYSDGGYENTWWRWPFYANLPQFLPFLVSMCVSSWCVGSLAYPLSADTYLCTHARIRLWSFRDPLHGAFMGFAVGWGTASVVVFLCVCIVTLSSKALSKALGKGNCCTCLSVVEHYISDPLIAYENWMAFPLYNLRAMRFNKVEYDAHCEHFLTDAAPVEDCRYCQELMQLLKDHDVNALEGEVLLCNMFRVPHQLPEFELAASVAKQAWESDPSDIEHLELCRAKLADCKDACIKACNKLKSKDGRSDIPSRLANAIKKGDAADDHLERILSAYSDLKKEVEKCLERYKDAVTHDEVIGAQDDLRAAKAEVKKRLQEKCPNFTPDVLRDTKGFKLWKEATEALDGAKIVSAVQVAVLCDAAANGDIKQLRHLKASTGKTETVKYLVPAASDFDLGSDYDHRTPLHIAASAGRLEVVKFLIEECGAKHDPRDCWQRRPLDDAIRNNKDEVRWYLEQFDFYVKVPDDDEW